MTPNSTRQGHGQNPQGSQDESGQGNLNAQDGDQWFTGLWANSFMWCCSKCGKFTVESSKHSLYYLGLIVERDRQMFYKTGDIKINLC